jgi:CheY-like chemotaxis protein
LVLSITDNGVGIPPDQLDASFEMFTRVRNDHAATPSGLGIGLALVRSLVEMHGGRVRAASAGHGRGAQFSVYLPLPIHEPATPERRPPDSPSGNGATRRVLVVDDNADAALVLSMLVKKLGHEVRVAYDGLQAVAAAEQFNPHIVFLDLGMPGLDGCSAAQQIRQQPWGADMLLVALTGWGQDGDRLRTQQAGFDHHLVKPADPDALRRLLHEKKGADAGREDRTQFI